MQPEGTQETNMYHWDWKIRPRNTRYVISISSHHLLPGQVKCPPTASKTLVLITLQIGGEQSLNKCKNKFWTSKKFLALTKQKPLPNKYLRNSTTRREIRTQPNRNAIYACFTTNLYSWNGFQNYPCSGDGQSCPEAVVPVPRSDYALGVAISQLI